MSIESSRVRNMFKVLASLTSTGSLFHLWTTQFAKKFCLTSVLDLFGIRLSWYDVCLVNLVASTPTLLNQVLWSTLSIPFKILYVWITIWIIDMLLSTDLYCSWPAYMWFCGCVSQYYIWVDPRFFWETFKPLHGVLKFHSSCRSFNKKIICSFKKDLNEVQGPNQRIALLKCGPWSKQKWYTIRAGRRSWGTILHSRERTELSRTIPSFQKKEHIERVLKNIETIITRTNVEQTKIAWKKR